MVVCSWNHGWEVGWGWVCSDLCCRVMESRFTPSWHYWHLELGYSLLWGVLWLCLPDASSIPHIPVVTTKNVSRLCQMSPGGQNHLPPPTPFEKHWCNPLKYSVYRETDFKVLMCIFPVIFFTPKCCDANLDVWIYKIFLTSWTVLERTCFPLNPDPAGQVEILASVWRDHLLGRHWSHVNILPPFQGNRHTR